jgi:hypothetical protein
MLALYRSGRQAEALSAYRDARRTLLDELGIEPGRALQELERAILAQDASLETAPAPRPAAPGRRAATPVVGRDQELALLEAGLEDALAGRGRLFVVAGGAGSGKTRLGDEIAAAARRAFGRGFRRCATPATRFPSRPATTTAPASAPSRPSRSSCATRRSVSRCCSSSMICRRPIPTHCC